MKKAKHILKLNGFDFEKGKIPFSVLNRISTHLIKRIKKLYFYSKKEDSPLDMKFDLEQKIKERNYSGFNRARFDKLINEMKVEEPIEELLNILSR